MTQTTSIFKDIEHLTISGGSFTFTHSPVNDDCTGRGQTTNHGSVLNDDRLSNNPPPVQNYDYRQHGTRQEPASNDDVSQRTPSELFNATIQYEYAASYERDEPECQDYQSQSPLGDEPCVDRSNRHPPRSRESQRTGSQCRQNDLVEKGRTPKVESEDELEERWRAPVKAQASTERRIMEMSRNKRSQTIPVGKPRKIKFEVTSEEEEEGRRELVNERDTTMERRSTEAGRHKRSQTAPTVELHKAKFENTSEEEEEAEEEEEEESLRKPVKERKKQASTAERRLTEMGSRNRRYDSGYEESTHEPVKDGGKRQATKEGRRKNKRSQTVPVRKSESEEEGDSGEEDPVEQTREATAKKKKAKKSTAWNPYFPSQMGNMGPPNLPWPYPGLPSAPGFPPGPTPWQGLTPYAGQWNLRHSKVTYSNNGNDYSTNTHSGNSSYSNQSNVGNDYSQNTSTIIKKRRH